MSRPAPRGRPRTWLAVWDVVVDEPAHVRAVGRRAFWRWKKGESGGLGGCYLLFSLPIVLIGALVVLDSVHFVGGATHVSWVPMLVALSGLGLWLGGPVLLGLLPDPVWEARPGSLRIGRRTWSADEVDHLLLEDRRFTRSRGRAGAPAAPQAERALRLFLVPKGGERVELGRFQTAPGAARALCQRLAAVSGLPMHVGRAARAELDGG